MTATENVAVQTVDAKKRDAEEMIKLFLKMSELERARVFGYAQGVESMTEKVPEQRAG